MSQAANLDVRLVEALAHLQRNELTRSEAALSKVLAEAPNDARALQLLGVLRRLQGRLGEAEELYRRSLAIEPAQPQVHHNLGNLLKTLNRLQESIAEQRAAIELKPNFADAHLALALTLSAMGDHGAAEKCCRDVLRLQPNHLAAKQTLAAELCLLNRPKEAEHLLRQTLALGVREPRQAAALEHNLGMALKQQRRFPEALVMFDAAQAKVPDLAAVDYSRGNTLQQMGRLEEAVQSYRKALVHDSGHLDARACLALLSTQTGDLVTARASAAEALVLRPAHPIATIALAITEIEARDFAAAEQKVTRVLDGTSGGSDFEAAFAAGFAADAFDRLGRTAEAFAVYSASNERKREFLAAAYGSARAIDDVNRLAAYFRKSAAWAPAASPATAGAPARHVFVLGFMRSGTTLLETILATNPHVAHIDEIEFLGDAARSFLLSEAGLDRLAGLEEAEAARWRNAYWNAVRDAGYPVAGTTFVDKMPFNTLRLPLICRLFPAASVIFAIRDPRDVVLSCFRRRFNPTPYSFEFLRLDDCARFYAATMTLAERYREKLPIDLHEHRYEDMVADFESSLRAVCDFTGIAWSESMRDFRASADGIDRRSPSAAQVRRGLYGDAVGQWRRYRDQLASILPILAPWIAKFGYPME